MPLGWVNAFYGSCFGASPGQELRMARCCAPWIWGSLALSARQARPLGMAAPRPPGRRLGGAGLDCESKRIKDCADLDDLVIFERQERGAVELDRITARRQLGPLACVRARNQPFDCDPVLLPDLL